MCGLAGLLNVDASPVSPVTLARMSLAVAHRGPDGDGLWTQGAVGLAHRRLAIIDRSAAGNQPMQTPDGRYTLIYNGEVYNFRELRVALEAGGARFRGRSDTEVVLQALAAEGPAALSRFNGMFALALWDAVERRLLLARDRHGIKPLYWARFGEALVFGSEIKALLRHPAARTRVCVPALQEYFAFQNIFTDGTLFDGVRIVPAGTWMTVDADGTTRSRRYWDYHFEEDPTIDAETAVRETRRLFEQAVQRQLVADTDVGAYLSGGIDSGSVTAIAAREMPGLRTFTCGFDLTSASGLELNFDERARAEHLSYLFKTEHYQVVLKAGDMERVMPQLIWHLEDLRVGQSYPNFYVSRLASRFVKVVLSGAGSDELFCGYPWRYFVDRPESGARAGTDGGSSEGYLSRHYAYWQRLMPDDVRAGLFRPAARMDTDVAFAAFRSVHGHRADALSGAGGGRPEDYVNLSLYFEARTFLHGLLVVEDRLSMAHGLETRLPFLDDDLVDFAMRMPVRHKLAHPGATERLDENAPGRKHERYFSRNQDGKRVLRQVLGQFVPESVTQARKQGFSAPDGSWFRGESVDYIRRLLLSPDARLYQWLEPAVVQGLLGQHFSGAVNRRLFVWSCLCFEWWLRTFDPEPAGSGASF